MAHVIEEQLAHVAGALVPIFFVVTGTLVDLGSMKEAIGLLITFLAIVTTVVAPIFLVPAFERGGSGLRHPPEPSPQDPGDRSETQPPGGEGA